MTATPSATAAPAAAAGGTALKVAMVLAISLFWGGNWPAVKTVLFEVPPLTLRAIGFSAGGAVLLTWALVRGQRLRIPAEEWPWLAVTGVLNILIFNLCTAFGQLLMPTSRAAIIAFTMPVWATLLALPVLGEKPGLRQGLGLALGMGGLLVLLGPEAVRGDGGPLLGPLLMVGAAVSWALGTVLMKRRGPWVSHVIAVTGWQYVLAAVPMIVMAALLDDVPAPAAWKSATWIALAYHVIFSICLAQMLWFLIVKHLTVGQATVATLLVPVVGVAGSVVVLGDSVTVRLVVALGMVVSAVACVVAGRGRKRRMGA